MKLLRKYGIQTIFVLVLSQCWLVNAGEREITQRVSARVIVDNDFAGDPDGLAALAHQLLSKKTETVLITVSGLDPELAKFSYRDRDTAVAGAQKANKLLALLGTEDVPVSPGYDLNSRDHNEPSNAAKAIVQAAMQDSDLPLFFTCGGPLTNLAEALKLEPAIAQRMTLIWIGGGDYPTGEPEYNLMTDLDAAKYVFEQSTVPIWQIPVSTYRQMQYSVAEMAIDFKPLSPASSWLYEQYTHLPPFVDMGGALTMGDHPLVTLSALSVQSSQSDTMASRVINPDGSYGKERVERPIRVFRSIDARLTFADFLAVMKLNNTKS